MNPLPSDPVIEGEYRHPSDNNNKGSENHQTQTHGCDTPCSSTKAGVPVQLKHATTEDIDGKTEEDEEFWLSEKPYCHFIVSKSHLRPAFHLVVPVKIQHILPQKDVPVVLTYRKKSWNMTYLGANRSKRFDRGWKKFVIDNNLRIGDACILELLEYSEEVCKFRVQILNGDIPDEFLDRIDGENPKNPIIIE